jgi:hypothetical protein
MSNNRRRPPKGPTYRWTWSMLFQFLSGYLSVEYDNPGNPYKETEELIAKTLAFLL